MASELTTIEVHPGSEIDRLLDLAMEGPLLLVRGNQRFWLYREADEDDNRAGYDPERAIAGMRAAARGRKDLGAEAMKEDVSRGREEGTRTPDRPERHDRG